MGYDGSEFTAGPQIPSKPVPSVDPTYLSPYKPGGSRAAHSDLSRSGSEPDSLLELYGRPRSQVDSMDHRDQSDTRDLFYLEDEDPERSRWIHRDKLALIESQEMREAGIKLPRPGRSSSKSNGSRAHRESSREPSRDRYRNGLHSNDLDSEEGKFQKLHGQAREDERRPNGTQESAVQTTEDTSPEPYLAANSAPHRQQGLRVSSSRIPVPKSTALPVPQGNIEKQSVIPRKRGTSGNWSGVDEDGIAYNKTRSRSHSVGSQILLDDGNPINGVTDQIAHTANHSSPSTSPTKRQTSKVGQSPSTNAKKATNALRNVSDAQKSRSPTTAPRSSPAPRPKSRSGLESRPATAINRPEGEAPWLATMYKPDPRLPPEQQLLPTHAKRLQQEREGGPGSTGSGSGSGPDDDEVGRLTVHTGDGLQPSPSSFSPQANVEKDEKDLSSYEPAWPLKASSIKENGSPVGGLNDHGGYSTIPKMQSAPTPPVGPMPSPKVGQRPLQPESRQEKEQGKEREGRKKGGQCVCCVVM